MRNSEQANNLSVSNISQYLHVQSEGENNLCLASKLADLWGANERKIMHTTLECLRNVEWCQIFLY